MSEVRAYELREAYVDQNFAGSVTLADGSTYDVAEALKGGKGTIVTDDADVILQLDGYPALKTAKVPEPARQQTVKGPADQSGAPDTPNTNTGR